MKRSFAVTLALLLLVASTALAQTPPEPASAAPLAAAPAEPLAGYANGNFFLRDPHDWFVLFPKARLQVDYYNFPNRGDSVTAGSMPMAVQPNSSKDPRNSIRDTIFVRRARVELQGTFMQHFDFHVAGEYATVPATGAIGAVTDAYVIVDYLPYLKLQAGQFDLPFTLENRTSDKYFDFMERSVAVRSFAVPTNKDLGAMVFGWAPKKVGYYSLGVFNGDGQSFKNQDNNPALVGRVFVAPLAWMAGSNRWMEDIWIGASFWWQRNENLGGPVAASVSGAAQADLPAMTTQGGFGFFSSNYNNGKDAGMNTVRTHLAPWGDTLKWALEANLPWKKIGLRFEFVHQNIALAEYNDTNPVNAMLTRTVGSAGTLDGYGTYLELYGWILGDVNFLETPGLEAAPRIKKFSPAAEPKWGLMLAAKYENINFDVTGLTPGNLALGNYLLHVFEFGVNAWATKHVRMTGNYVMNYLDGDSPQAKGNLFFQRPEHELLFRLGVAL